MHFLSDRSRLFIGFPSVLQQNGIQEEIKCLDQIKKIEAAGYNQEMTSFEINLKEKK